MRAIIMFIIGFLLVTFGVTMIFKEWTAFILVFKAVIGPLLAVLGLVILFAATLKT